jgi:hypothetical protein
MDITEYSRNMSKALNEASGQFNEEQRSKLRKWMMDTQRKTKAPKKAFHATSMDNVDSINRDGINPHPVYGEIYLCETIEDCLKFVPRPCAIYEVNTKNLLPKRWRASDDHSYAHYRCDVYCYYGHISPENIKGVTLFN